uniref:Uncharacterized protein n=1 Tax=Anguilla anguilla TaxID=7936 RepID=A0A0E9RYG4_ANGAN
MPPPFSAHSLRCVKDAVLDNGPWSSVSSRLKFKSVYCTAYCKQS